jgi:CRISPR-associated protein Cas2
VTEEVAPDRGAERFLLISYDIVNDRRRTKVHDTLKDFGTRVQYSVFECRLDRESLARLKNRLRPLVNLREDSLRFYMLCEGDVKKIRVLGRGRVTEVEGFTIVG